MGGQRYTDTIRFDGSYIHWGETQYRARSGPFGKGILPNGRYKIERYKAVVSEELSESFEAADGKRWFLPITILTWAAIKRANEFARAAETMKEIGRTGLGMHPDGGQKGTEGCVGFEPEDAVEFFARLNGIFKVSDRPEFLMVDANHDECLPCWAPECNSCPV